MPASAPDRDAAPIRDVLVVGAGPAGLTAATYLARFRRDPLVVGAGASRARWIPASHNCPGFPHGIGGETLLSRLREQAEGVGVRIERGRITRLARDGEGFLAEAGDGRQWRVRTVLLATGIVDVLPAMEDAEAAIACHALRLCAICDAYEASDERIGVLAPIDEAIRHAAFLRTFSRRVFAIPSAPGEASADCLRLAQEAGVAVAAPMQSSRWSRAGGCEIRTRDGVLQVDTLYPVLGADAQSGLARALGAAVDEHGELRVDAHQQTSIAGLYAIGDVVSGLNQISVAMGHAAIAATAIHNRLPRNLREVQAAG